MYRRSAGFILALFFFTGSFSAWSSDQASAALLFAKLEDIQDKLQNNQFDAPIYMETTSKDSVSRGEVYGLLNYPFQQVAQSLRSSNNWCDVITLHLNSKVCISRSTENNRALVDIYVGKKTSQEAGDKQLIQYKYQVNDPSPDYLHVLFEAGKGPYGTSNYVIDIEAIPVANGNTFIHFTYAYQSGFVSNLAMNIYLSTTGSHKLGFSIVGYDADDKPQYVRGMQGVIERNAMRYFLAIEAYLGSLNMPEAERFEQRIARWYSLTQRYNQQLYEIDRDEYLDAKRKEHAQQLLMVSDDLRD